MSAAIVGRELLLRTGRYEGLSVHEALYAIYRLAYQYTTLDSVGTPFVLEIYRTYFTVSLPSKSGL